MLWLPRSREHRGQPRARWSRAGHRGGAVPEGAQGAEAHRETAGTRLGIHHPLRQQGERWRGERSRRWSPAAQHQAQLTLHGRHHRRPSGVRGAIQTRWIQTALRAYARHRPRRGCAQRCDDARARRIPRGGDADEDRAARKGVCSHTLRRYRGSLGAVQRRQLRKDRHARWLEPVGRGAREHLGQRGVDARLR